MELVNILAGDGPIALATSGDTVATSVSVAVNAAGGDITLAVANGGLEVDTIDANVLGDVGITLGNGSVTDADGDSAIEAAELSINVVGGNIGTRDLAINTAAHRYLDIATVAGDIT